MGQVRVEPRFPRSEGVRSVPQVERGCEQNGAETSFAPPLTALPPLFASAHCSLRPGDRGGVAVCPGPLTLTPPQRPLEGPRSLARPLVGPIRRGSRRRPFQRPQSPLPRPGDNDGARVPPAALQRPLEGPRRRARPLVGQLDAVFNVGPSSAPRAPFRVRVTTVGPAVPPEAPQRPRSGERRSEEARARSSPSGSARNSIPSTSIPAPGRRLT